MNVLSVFEEYRNTINIALQDTFERLYGELSVGLSEPSIMALQRLRDYSLRPGKRIRGSLAAATYDEAAGTHMAKPGIQLGVALELVQNYLLIIDDVMDRSALRRGEPTMHELYLQQTDPRINLHEAQMVAINIGQLAQHLASLVITEIEVSGEVIREATRLLHVNIIMTGAGQIDDLYQKIGRNVSREDIIRKYRAKSSYYTFINPMQCGFALAGKATPKTLDVCRRFGLSAGVAFQLRDDYLGIFAETEDLGKPNLDDIQEGKYTLLVEYALRHVSSSDSERLKSILGDETAKEKDLMIIRKILGDSGAVAAVQAATVRLADDAREVILNSSWSKNYVRLLQSLVTFSIERQV